MNTKPLLIVLAVVVVLIVGYLAYSMSEPAAAPTQTATTTDTSAPATPSTNTNTTSSTSGTPSAVTITYGANGFSPANVTVKVGTTVTWVNNSGNSMWVASAQHPTHTAYDGTSTSEHCSGGTATSASVFDQCGAGTRYSFIFTKTGAWSYHNHADSSDRGTITVTP